MIHWIPACAGMAEKRGGDGFYTDCFAGMTRREAGMTRREAGMTRREAGMTKREPE